MWLRVLLAGAGLAGLLCACAVVDPVDNRYDTIGRSLAKARNESIFLNLVRAGHDYPLSFSVISQVTPSLTNVTNLGLPSFLFGPHVPTYAGGGAVTAPLFTPGRDVIFGNTTASDSTTVSTNFNVATQETAAFYQGFLKPIDLITLDYFIRQGYPRELLFWLFTDSFELSGPTGTFGYKYDPPNDYGCDPKDKKERCFIDWVHITTLAGLTVEEKSAEKESSAKGGSGGKDSSGSSKPTTVVYARFCNNRILGQQAAEVVLKTRPDLLAALMRGLDVPFSALYGPTIACGGAWDPTKDAQKPQADVLPLVIPPFKVRIIPRSAYGVFEFLGTLIKLRLQGEIPQPLYLPPGRSAEEIMQIPPMLATLLEDPALLQVVRGSGPRCFSHTWFYDGDYCVPEDAVTTKRIFSLLAQLIAITTAASDLSITPIVRVVQ